VDDLLAKKDPTFVRMLPYFCMLDALRSDWHRPKDISHSTFGDQMKGKSELLGKVYAALLKAEKLKFHSQLPGIKKLGERFPFAWASSASAMNDLGVMHERLRTVFARDILMSEKFPGTRADPKNPLNHASVSTEVFQTAYQTYLNSPDLTPAVDHAHKMGIGFLQHNWHLFSQREETLRSDPTIWFARNVIVLMLMHCETVIEHQKEKEKAQFAQTVEQYVQRLAVANPSYVDLDSFVRLDKTVVKNENLKKKMIDALRSHQNVKSLEIHDRPTFGNTRLILFAFHTSQLETICDQSYSNGREHGNYALHVNLERIYDCVQDPARLMPLIKSETYERFLQTRQDYFFSQMPFLKRLLWRLFGFARKVDAGRIADFMKTTIRTELHNAATFKEKVARNEARREQARIARAAVKGARRPEAEAESSKSENPLADLEPASAAGQSNSMIHESAKGTVDAQPQQKSATISPGTNLAGAVAPQVSRSPVESATPGFDATLLDRESVTPAEERASHRGRMSLEELSAKVETSDPDHIHFLKERPKATPPQPRVEPDWEQQVVNIGRKMGVDLTEQRRLERKREKEIHKRERHALAIQKLQKRKEQKKSVAQRSVVRTAPEPTTPQTPKHLVIIEVPTKYYVQGKPARIQFQKKFFKSESFRKEMADFYRKSSDSAPSPEEKQYFAFLIGALEKGFSKYLK